MNLQYIFDSNGNTTGVFIPINEWNLLRQKYKGIDDEERTSDIPEWQKDSVLQRLEKYKEKGEEALHFDEAIDNIEEDI